MTQSHLYASTFVAGLWLGSFLIDFLIDQGASPLVKFLHYATVFALSFAAFCWSVRRGV